MFSQDLPVFKCCILLNDKFQARVIPHFLGAIAGFLAQDWLRFFPSFFRHDVMAAKFVGAILASAPMWL